MLEGQALEEAPSRNAGCVSDLAPVVGETIGERLGKRSPGHGEVPVHGRENAADGADDVVRDLPHKTVGMELRPARKSGTVKIGKAPDISFGETILE